jgi:peptide chain release factor 1
MFRNLDHLVIRFEELTERLNSGTLDPRDFQKIAKEQAGLRELVATYRSHRKAEEELADNKTLIAAESDSEMRQMIKQDITRLEGELQDLTARLKVLLLPKDPNDEKNIILEIRAGTGGEEASLFAGDLFRMYARYAERSNWRLEILSASDGAKGGFKEVIAMISGERVYSRLKFEGGIHRVQRVPETEASGRIHTSAVTVAVLPEAEDVEVNVPEHELRVDVFRAGGHGGQSVNTTDSAVRLTHLPTGLVVICQDEKSQHKNKAKALKVLRARLLDKFQAEQNAKETIERRAMVGSGDRSEKIRTYNFPQSRVTDHRIGLTLHSLPDVLDGAITPILDALTAHFQAESLKSQAAGISA